MESHALILLGFEPSGECERSPKRPLCPPVVKKSPMFQGLFCFGWIQSILHRLHCLSSAQSSLMKSPAGAGLSRRVYEGGQFPFEPQLRQLLPAGPVEAAGAGVDVEVGAGAGCRCSVAFVGVGA